LSNKLNDHQHTLFIPNLELPPWDEAMVRLGHPWKSFFALQVRVHNKRFGSIVFADRSTRPGGLADADRDLAQLMGVYVGTAIERSEHEQRVEQLAFHDALTGLPNRVLFDDRIRQTIATAKRYDRGFAVMYLDLDNFKSVNDELGHPAGDLLLRLVADRLRKTLRESDTVARFGGDEFVILQPIVQGASDTSDMARKIVSAMQVPFDLNGAQRTIHTSIGISLFPYDADAIDSLMDNADKALYRAKRTGRNRWVFFNEEEQRRQWPGGV
ncbi:MAG: sensor domain-containing diguanylate cyclase, partial [Candidatus Eremiobacteraeota bacterium]|nr:sensor domain-containing diguanylate cyclase [Candidatus Eremiobacteraeota bacterium]